MCVCVWGGTLMGHSGQTFSALVISNCADPLFRLVLQPLASWPLGGAVEAVPSCMKAGVFDFLTSTLPSLRLPPTHTHNPMKLFRFRSSTPQINVHV